jgi:invasion protein IalB
MISRLLLPPHLAVFLVFCGAAAAAPAQPSEIPATGGNWRVECAASEKALDCRAVVSVVQRDNHQVIASLTVRYPRETKKPVFMIQVPLGVLVSEPVSIAVDGGKPEQTGVQTCTQAGCFAGDTASDALIAAMQNGKQLKIVFYNVNKQPVTVTLPLTGFDLAYAKIKS